MQQIFKYPLAWGFGRATAIDLPRGANVLCVQTQESYLCLWAIVDPLEEETDERYFYVAATDVPLPEKLDYLDTCQIGPLVAHIFEVNQDDD